MFIFCFPASVLNVITMHFTGSSPSMSTTSSMDTLSTIPSITKSVASTEPTISPSLSLNTISFVSPLERYSTDENNPSIPSPIFAASSSRAPPYVVDESTCVGCLSITTSPPSFACIASVVTELNDGFAPCMAYLSMFIAKPAPPLFVSSSNGLISLPCMSLAPFTSSLPGVCAATIWLSLIRSSDLLLTRSSSVGSRTAPS